MHLVQSLDKMSDIHSTITTTAGCLFYQLVSFAFEVKASGSQGKYLLLQCLEMHTRTDWI